MLVVGKFQGGHYTRKLHSLVTGSRQFEAPRVRQHRLFLTLYLFYTHLMIIHNIKSAHYYSIWPQVIYLG